MALFMAIRVFNKILSRKEIFEERQQFGLDYFATPINFLLKIGAIELDYLLSSHQYHWLQKHFNGHSGQMKINNQA